MSGESTIGDMLGPDLLRSCAAMTAYRYAAYLYHHEPDQTAYPSPMTDADFDTLERHLGLGKDSGHAVELASDEIELARNWSKRHRDDLIPGPLPVRDQKRGG